MEHHDVDRIDTGAVLARPLLREMSLELPDHYTHDGSLNHPQHLERGMAGTPRIRAHPPLHSYRIPGETESDEPLWQHPRLDLPSARRILVELFQRVEPRRNERASQLLMAFGHFVVRDITRTVRLDESEPMPIECDLVETRGPFCPRGAGQVEFHRSIKGGATGEPVNFATTWLDMDHVYGNDPPSSPDYLRYRTGVGGRMRVDESTSAPPVDPDTGLFAVYDNAMRQLPADLALLSVYLHYHNRRASYHEKQHPEWDDEALFQRARMDTITSYQMTFETNYIPAVLGGPLSNYTGYDPDADARIDVFFSTSSFRYGHSGMSSVARLVDREWNPLPLDPMLMRDMFDRTEEVLRRLATPGGGGEEGGQRRQSALAVILRGLALDSTRAPDAAFADDMSLFMA